VITAASSAIRHRPAVGRTVIGSSKLLSPALSLVADTRGTRDRLVVVDVKTPADGRYWEVVEFGDRVADIPSPHPDHPSTTSGHSRPASLLCSECRHTHFYSQTFSLGRHVSVCGLVLRLLLSRLLAELYYSTFDLRAGDVRPTPHLVSRARRVLARALDAEEAMGRRW